MHFTIGVGVAEGRCFLRLDVREHRDHAVRAERKQGKGGVIVARPEACLASEIRQKLRSVADVSRCVLDADYVRNREKLTPDRGRDVHTRARGDCVNDDGQRGRRGDLSVVADETRGGAFVIVGRDREEGVGAALFCRASLFDCMFGAVRAHSHDDGNSVICCFYRLCKESCALVVGERRGLARCAADEECVDARIELKMKELTERIEVERAVLLKWCNQSGSRAEK